MVGRNTRVAKGLPRMNGFVANRAGRDISRYSRPAWIAWTPLLATLLTLSHFMEGARGAADEKSPQAVRIHFEGVITPWSEQFLLRRLDQAKGMGANLVIVEIDSPGGMVEPSFAIAEHLRDLDWAKTIAYIPREALSGAAFVALGCDEIVMRPGARLGDAGPIILGEDSLFRHAPEKIVSDLAVRLRALAEAKKRPPALAEAMVNRNLEVFEMRNKKEGTVTFLSEPEIAQLDDPEDWEKGKLVFESRKDHFLEVVGKRAVELELANSTVAGEEQLFKILNIDGMPPLLKQTYVDTLVSILNIPFVTILILVVGLVCLYVELHIPGFGVAGLISALCFVLFFWSRMLGGTAGWLEVLLFFGGVVCVALELFVIPGFGVTGVTGVLLIISSIVLASQTFIIPHTVSDFESLGQSAMVMGATAVVAIGLATFLGRYFDSLPMFRRMVLPPPKNPESLDEFSETSNPLPGNRGWLLDQEGIATTFLRPAGKARFRDETVDVVTEGSFISSGSRVRVISVQGNRVVVKEIG